MIFLNADDDIADGFIDKRWRTATAAQADVMIFNAWHSDAGYNRNAVHRKQPSGKPCQVMTGYGTALSGTNDHIISGCR